MNIHVLGIRGLPSTYSGYETFAGELVPRLVSRGHEVTVYCRRSLFKDRPAAWKGARLKYLPSLEFKAFSTLSHSAVSMLSAVMERPDVILTVNAATGWFTPIARLGGVPCVINVNGMEWLRPKWNRVGRWMFLNGARTACRFASAVVTDAEEMHQLYARKFGINSVDIAYGANIEASQNPEKVREYGLEPGKYFLIASRLVPDNNADLIVEAFSKVDTPMHLAIAGGANYKGNHAEREFIKKLETLSDNRVKFLGHIDDNEAVRELHANCFAYIHGHQFGGTNPSLLKALGYGNLILALNTPFNAEVLMDGKYGLLYEKSAESLYEQMNKACSNPDLAQGFRDRAPERIKERYTWEQITDQYESLLNAAAKRRSRKAMSVNPPTVTSNKRKPNLS